MAHSSLTIQRNRAGSTLVLPLTIRRLFLNDNLRDVLCFKQNIINGRKSLEAEPVAWIVTIFTPTSHLTIVYFLRFIC